ncbi:hypothetical protein ACHHYP_20224 [Achlya hypogyna]|uniref:Uncharacterized protein n=1 Tax=Achlya hypogyna TaxID=1202772 RepID=A0A1V9YXV3_ACHHY|nr:hypothetical protein ACHHYP_20224 [Achlya hypogyna]
MTDYSPLATTFVLLGVGCCIMGHRMAYLVALFLALFTLLSVFYISPLWTAAPIVAAATLLYIGHRRGNLPMLLHVAMMSIHALSIVGVCAISVYAMHPYIDLLWAIVVGVTTVLVAVFFTRSHPRTALVVSTATLGAGLIMHGSTFSVPQSSFGFLHLIGICTLEAVSIPLQLYCGSERPLWRRPSMAATDLATPTPRNSCVATPVPMEGHIAIAIVTPPLDHLQDDK